MTAPRRILVAMSSFKGTMSAAEACRMVENGLRTVWPDAEIESGPLADGGRGAVESLLRSRGGQLLHHRVTGPLGDPVEAAWAKLDDGSVVIEMSAASGLTLVPPSRRDPWFTTTYGTGELLLAAAKANCPRIYLGLGDSATVEGGLGAAQAAGARFFTSSGGRIESPIAGRDLARIAAVEIHVAPELQGIDLRALCDVDNPLLGQDGAARVYGPQKGASPERVEQLEGARAQAYDLIEQALGRTVRDVPGAGAAGGFGAAAMAFWNGKLAPGAPQVLDLADFDEKLSECDLVITGEGSFDRQTLRGKGPAEAARRARQRYIRACALVGVLGDGPEPARECGLDPVIELSEKGKAPPSPEEARRDLFKAAARLAREIM